jgi:broad specificity phosphatase PhoE
MREDAGATTFYLVRHGHVGGPAQRLNGRAPGVNLSAGGRRQAERLAMRLASQRVAALYSSPMLRAVQTATTIASVTGMAVSVEDALDELDFGEWTNRSCDDLDGDPAWIAFNRVRGVSRVPGGESMAAVQARVVEWLTRTANGPHAGIVVAVSHADVIRAALGSCAGVGLDAVLRWRIAPASITEVVLAGLYVEILRVNDTAHLEIGAGAWTD